MDLQLVLYRHGVVPCGCSREIIKKFLTFIKQGVSAVCFRKGMSFPLERPAETPVDQRRPKILFHITDMGKSEGEQEGFHR